MSKSPGTGVLSGLPLLLARGRDALSGLAARVFKKREIHTEIYIAADPGLIWSIITDLEKYREWNPFILRSRGKAQVGQRLECRPRLPGSRRVHRFRPVVTRCVPPEVFAWKGHAILPGLADGEHIFELFRAGEGVRLVHRQNFWGLAVPLVWKAIAPKTAAGFELMNRALKERAEKKGTTACPNT